MGTFNYPIEIGDPQGQRFEHLQALVDIGATYTAAPSSFLRRLGVVPYTRATFVLSDGRRVEMDIGETRIRVDGQSATTIVVFGEEQAAPVLGAYTLEGLRLAVDPVQKRLVPTAALLMSRAWPSAP